MRCASPPDSVVADWPELDVAEADLAQRLQLLPHLGDVLEELARLRDRHVEHVGDAGLAVAHLQRLAVVAPAAARLALDVDVGQEVHLDADDAVALAGLAAPALDVERVAPRLVAARLRLGQVREQIADVREHARVRRRVRARRAPDRRLVDVDHLVDVLQAVQPVVRLGRRLRVVQLLRQRAQQRVDHQRRLARARHAGHAGQHADREADRHVRAGCARARACTRQHPVARLAALARHLDHLAPRQVRARQRVRVAGDVVGRARGDDAPAVHARARAPCR